MTRCLIVFAHPSNDSLNARFAAKAEAQARAAGWEVTRRDLYASGFDPRLSAEERKGYYATPPESLREEKQELSEAEVLILVFPTWWYGFPAVLKGWFDRVWAPGLAYDHSPGFGPMLPRLTNLQEVLAVTTMGAPGWVDWLVMWRPLWRILRFAIVKPCAPQACVTWRVLYRSEAGIVAQIERFETMLVADIQRMKRRLK